MSQTGVVRPLSAQPVDSGDEDEVTDRASVEVDVKAASEENNSGEICWVVQRVRWRQLT